jgi:hypothetical protein
MAKIIAIVIAVSAVIGGMLVTAVAQDDPLYRMLYGRRAKAAIAFDKGSEAYLDRDFIKAGLLFQKADIAMRSASALISAARSFLLAGDKVTASRLSELFVLRYSNTEKTTGVSVEKYVICLPKMVGD